MTDLSRFLLRIARWIAGSQRREWVDAMEAEAASAGTKSTAWAFGCLWATLSDRIIRERRVLLSILLMPICVNVLQFLLFFPVVWVARFLGLPAWTFIVVFILLPFPFAFALGKSMPLLRALITATLSSLVLDIAGIVIFWISFGQGPEIWFEKGSHVYNMPPLLGWTCSLGVWLAGAWLGSKWRSPASHTPVTD